MEVVILKGSFDSDDWTTEEFNQNIIEEMNGRNILKGNVFIQLKDGIGTLGDLSILHDKRWKRVTMLRLGARFMDSFPNIKVREAKSKSFTMKDKRMKVNRKDAKLLSLMDRVCCLKHIGKCEPVIDRLTNEGIQTIEDFLKLYFLHRVDLLRILGHGWTEMKMEATINHALKCKGSMALKRDALSRVNKEEVVVCAYSNGPFSSSSSMMDENVGAEAVVGSAFVTGEMSNGHDPTANTPTAGEIISSNEHFNAIGYEGNVPNNIFQAQDLFMDHFHMDEFNWNNNSMLPPLPSSDYMDVQFWQFDDFED